MASLTGERDYVEGILMCSALIKKVTDFMEYHQGRVSLHYCAVHISTAATHLLTISKSVAGDMIPSPVSQDLLDMKYYWAQKIHFMNIARFNCGLLSLVVKSLENRDSVDLKTCAEHTRAIAQHLELEANAFLTMESKTKGLTTELETEEVSE